MPESLFLVILTALAALTVLGLGLITFRLFGDQGLICPPMPAAYRGASTGGAWRRGTLRFTDDRLTLRGPGGHSVGPWLRGHLDLGMAGAVTGQEAQELGRADLIQVPVSYGSSSFDLALGEGHYTALRAWVEAAPPGWRGARVS